MYAAGPLEPVADLPGDWGSLDSAGSTATTIRSCLLAPADSPRRKTVRYTTPTVYPRQAPRSCRHKDQLNADLLSFIR